MKSNRIAIALSLINLLLMIFLIAQLRPAKAQTQQQQRDVVPVLRGRALEIIDSLGRVRASISVLPPVELDGKKYSQTVLLRLIDSKGGPLVKLGADENGSGLNLSDPYQGGVQILARDSSSFIKIKSHSGGEQVIKP